MAGKLYLFTTSFPFGAGEQFIETEIKYLAQAFSVVEIYPLHNNSPAAPRRSVPDNVIVRNPLLSGHKVRRYFEGIANRAPVRFIIDEWIERPPKGYRQIASLVRSALVLRTLISHKLTDVVKQASKQDVLYFYWGAGACYVLPFVRFRDAVSVVRFHNFDLYEETTGGYLPFRKALLSSVDLVVTISAHGASYLRERYPEAHVFPHVHRLGTEDFGLSKPSTDGIFRIVSCSNIAKQKRVALIANSLARARVRIEWTHIGDGPLRDDVESIIRDKPDRLSVRLMGRMSNAAVKAFYGENPVDLFINLSTHEGVPVSIMEALSAGVPVLASNSGGVGELVNDSVGRLIPVEADPESVAAAIEELAECRDERTRANARERWERMCNAAVRYRIFAEFLEKAKVRV